LATVISEEKAAKPKKSSNTKVKVLYFEICQNQPKKKEKGNK